jgi:hypothetical protein
MDAIVTDAQTREMDKVDAITYDYLRMRNGDMT